MQNEPLVSIVTTCYNQEKFISTTIASIEKQYYKNWEMIIIDDKSTDNSLEIIERQIQKLKISRKVIILQNIKNRGCGYSLRKAIKQAKGELIAVIDGDDALVNSFVLYIMVQTHRRNPQASLVYSDYYLCDGELIPKRVITSRQLTPSDSYLGSSTRISHLKMFKLNLYNKTDGVNSYLRQAIDKDLVLKLEEVGDLIHLPLPLYYYRHHKDSLSSSEKTKSKIYQNSLKLMRHQIQEAAKTRRKIQGFNKNGQKS